MDAQADPISEFQHWFQDAEAGSGLEFPNAVALATVSADGRPSARMVLIKLVNKTGFCFFTNYESRKGSELAARPFAALCFYWESLGRQVRVEGRVEKLSKAESEEYFHTRARGSQLGAWASPQSRQINSREQLEKAIEDLDERFGDSEIPLPPHWGGYRLVPDRMEFWTNGKHRLHERTEYIKNANDAWSSRQLAP